MIPDAEIETSPIGTPVLGQSSASAHLTQEERSSAERPPADAYEENRADADVLLVHFTAGCGGTLIEAGRT